jgi:hypothetical protein
MFNKIPSELKKYDCKPTAAYTTADNKPFIYQKV